ncbi:MAG: cytochrome c3 family protein [Longimicrobiales bacterium]
MSQLRFAVASLVLLGSALVPASLTAQATEPIGPDSVVYTNRGRVVFHHKTHGEKFECASCHHEAMAEKAFERPRQKCSDCHTDPPTPPMTTTQRNAMHDTEARAGICFDCHKAEEAKGAKVPTRCADCHVRESAGAKP